MNLRMQMSVSEILDSAASLEMNNFERLYQGLLSLRTQKQGLPNSPILEAEILNKINEPFDPKKWDRLTYLDWKLEFSALSEKEAVESLKLTTAYEKYSIERLKALSQLAIIRKISLDQLLLQLDIIPELK
jgi:hypothetical protein